ncbi:hypothetical protein Rhopal_006369-T1 [Rhodotorula paludigena]|uniref:mRNA-decapping enzyme C-terminal domain-containing protein n=1 Tax=Rhodotorula paludigena TaxID=86838 RepID=A0AAV5GWA4_9BASI|nr:hypothetical protein Rhopal_006369-T1 [Rhodotorula paludigena]
MALSAKEEIRQQLNLKNLQRHDPRIDRIITSTSHASLYDNKGTGWVKTGVEGPLFLFSRSVAPNYGFFVLNRNGLEYVQEFLTPECEVKSGGEFILFESGTDAGCLCSPSPLWLLMSLTPTPYLRLTDRATGIWVSEERERVELSQRMEQLRAKSAAAAAASAYTPSAPTPASPPQAVPVGQSISLDMLFKAASPAPAPAVLPAQPSPLAQQQPVNPLDALFAAATVSPSPARATLPSASPALAANRMPTQLEQLFAAASPTPQAAQLPLSPPQQSRPPPLSPAAQPTGMALLDSIFASAQGVSSPQPLAQQLPPRQQPAQTYASPSPAPATLPFSSAASPPAAPRDARDLLAMLGHPVSPPASAPAPAPIVQPGRPAQAHPIVNGDLPFPPTTSAAPPEAVANGEPRSTMHPAPFSMDATPAGGASLHRSAVAEAPKPAENEPKPGPPAPVSAKKAPMFAPPVLSHDVFSMLPLPGGASKTKKKEEAPAPVETPATAAAAPLELQSAKVEDEVPARNETEAEELVEVAKEPAAPAQATSSEATGSTTALPSPPAPTSPPATASADARELASITPRRTPSQQQASLLLDKAAIVDFADSAAKNAKVGLLDGAVTSCPMEKDVFIRRIVELLQKPSLSMQLYGRYLERYEELQE